MKFGQVSPEELDDLVLELPPDHLSNSQFLSTLGSAGDPQLFVGCAKWGRDEWVGQIYPEGTRDKDFLANYVQHFNAIELNATFYQTRKSNVEKWAEQGVDGFRFCPKFTRRITHLKRLKDVEESTRYYLDAIDQFGPYLGPSFLQLPENYSPKYLDRLEVYLRSLPAGANVVVELRHPEWYANAESNNNIFELLQELGFSAVITDVAGRRDCLHQRLTSDKVFIRFNGYGWHHTDFTRMDEWVDRILQWMKEGVKEVYFFAHQQDESQTPATADYFLRKYEERTGIQVKRPRFIERPSIPALGGVG